jgi:hypothetical protein
MISRKWSLNHKKTLHAFRNLELDSNVKNGTLRNFLKSHFVIQSGFLVEIQPF